MKKICNATNIEWGICKNCSHKIVETLCDTCLLNRRNHFLNQLEIVKKSWEFRFRNWLCKILTPQIRYK